MRAIGKRIFIFLAVNFLIILTVSLILNLLNIGPYFKARGIDMGALLAFCLVWGMTGAFISLALSRIMAKWLMGVAVIDPDLATGQEKLLIDMVYKLARRAGLPKMPEVGIYHSPEVNAFATGPTKSRALVAVSSGLLREMRSHELEGVLGHEVSHISNGDMVTMTLVQGLVNAFVMFFARAIAYIVLRLGRRSDQSRDESPFLYSILVMVFEIIFFILGAIVIATYSRFREFRADSGGARLAGRDQMIDALKALQRTLEVRDERAEAPAFQSMKISNTRGLIHLFSTHPSLDERIARLEQEG
jgi:heat shock protein HtpX